jgi:1-deoxy-D-xylulose-5-phosphate reductoisomerase
MDFKKQRVTVLGSTGSVGVNTLDVISAHPERFEVFALSAATQVDLMLAQCQQFRPRFAVMVSAPHAALLAEKIKANSLATQVIPAAAALEMIASNDEVDTVMAAIVGAAGLAACMAAAKAGKRLLLANKEALVVGGDLFLQAVRTGGATLLPIDSEHSAVFQSLPDDASSWAAQIEKIILTASGGPFLVRALDTLKDVSPEEACAHPNWVMGRKISVDSATMMNKALEVIEAKYLFGVAAAQIEVVIHPQSIVHSMVQYRDTSVIAQLGCADMRVPIAFGLGWPDRVHSKAKPLDFSRALAMHFEPIDHTRFPGLKLAWEVLEGPSGATAVLNAANEVAVAAFLEKKLRFDQIFWLNRTTLDRCAVPRIASLNDLLELDLQARALARELALTVEI